MSAVRELLSSIRHIYGSTVEVSFAIQLLKIDMEQRSRKQPATPDGLVFFGTDDPNDSDARFQYRTRLSKLIEKSSKDGPNDQFIYSASIVLIYSLWEAEYRRRIATELGCRSEDLLHPALGDLKNIRHAILHASSRLDKNLKLFDFFHKGEKLIFNGGNFYFIVSVVYSYILELAMGADWAGFEPFDLALNSSDRYRD